jgi:4-hydroxy-3-methylbut-2-en-1-yl diphosphate reductase
MKDSKIPKKLLLAAPRGFCAGVEMAIACLDKALTLYDAPIYVFHQIVHNKFLVSRYEARGVVFVNSL